MVRASIKLPRSLPPIDVPCPTCGVSSGDPCEKMSGRRSSASKPMRGFHQERLNAAIEEPAARANPNWQEP